MFAVDICTLCMAHSVTIPPVVSACIFEVERRGIRIEGIYRVSIFFGNLFFGNDR